MKLLPVISRELRAAARQRFTFTLRILGACALLVVCMHVVFNGGVGHNAGGQLFGFLHSTLFLVIWFLAPLLTAGRSGMTGHLTGVGCR